MTTKKLTSARERWGWNAPASEKIAAGAWTVTGHYSGRFYHHVVVPQVDPDTGASSAYTHFDGEYVTACGKSQGTNWSIDSGLKVTCPACLAMLKKHTTQEASQ